MSQKTKLICIKCEKTESPLWHPYEDGILCNDCQIIKDEPLKEPHEIKKEPEDRDEGENSNGSKNENGSSKVLRRSTRNTRQYKTRLNPFALPKAVLPKGKGRRVIFKKTPTKAPTAVATPVTSDSIFYKGSYIQIGDIVSMLDENDDVYYAQIRGLLTDQYCEKSAVITWLLPTEESPPPNERFDPATYVIGPEEDIPRKLECMEFIMHAPSEYFKSKNTPYPIVHAMPEPGFIWTSLRPVDRVPQKYDLDSSIDLYQSEAEGNNENIENIVKLEDDEET